VACDSFGQPYRHRITDLQLHLRDRTGKVVIIRELLEARSLPWRNVPILEGVDKLIEDIRSDRIRR